MNQTYQGTIPPCGIFCGGCPRYVNCHDCLGAEYGCHQCKGIYQCCVTKKQLQFCHQCSSYPCFKFKQFARRWDKYGQDLLGNQAYLKTHGETTFRRFMRVGKVSQLDISPLLAEDVSSLIQPMTFAFDDDAFVHLGQEKMGPPGYDDGSFLTEYAINNGDSKAFKLVADGQPVGAFIVWWNPNGTSVLGNIFVDPAYQGKGIGTQAWAYIEQHFPTLTWRLDTPNWSTRNHRFYEQQCGFIKVDEQREGVIYEKSY
jgi:GNAT superfamily N-acetyltransferase